MLLIKYQTYFYSLIPIGKNVQFSSEKVDGGFVKGLVLMHFLHNARRHYLKLWSILMKMDL